MVKDRGILVGVRLAGLMGPDIKLFIICPVLDPPHYSGEAPLLREGNIVLDNPIGEF